MLGASGRLAGPRKPALMAESIDGAGLTGIRAPGKSYLEARICRRIAQSSRGDLESRALEERLRGNAWRGVG
ncbi:MAG: hypothetical protein N838_29045 [Thiohalocapsa sp. PB-PSB1]|nr:MAG: hypothetical protein N838_29045 [Thiohalocapsa sp. PB-PSB1]